MKTDLPQANADTPPILSLATRHAAPASGQRSAQPGVVSTDRLFQGQQEILISHHGEHYRLRITRNGKLILTK